MGNIRLSYSVDPSNNVLKIIEENHYYPFGLKHSGYNAEELMYARNSAGVSKIVPVPPFLTPSFNYKYNGKEFQDDLGLNVYDYGARMYDPGDGLWLQMDPLAELGRRWSPYCYAFDNPVFFIDKDGMWPDPSWLTRYAKAAWSATANLAVGAATGTYNNVRNGINATKSVANAYQTGGVKAAASEYANQVYATSGVKSAVETLQKATTGNPEAIAKTVVNVSAVALIHQIGKGSAGITAASETSEASAAASKANTLKANRAQGANFENQVQSQLENSGNKVASQVTIEAADGTRTRPDFVTVNSEGTVGITEAKSSANAPLTPNQKTAFPQIEQGGGTIIGNGGIPIGLPAGTRIPPTPVDIVRPNNN